MKLAIIGVGSAGIQSLCHFLSHLDESWEVTSIHNPSKNILGIGESSNPAFVQALERGLDFSFSEDLYKINGTMKFGTKYTNWRPQEFINPVISGNIAVHFDTHSLYKFSMDRLVSKWKDKFKIIKGNVDNLENNVNEVKIQIDGEEHIFDYAIDCSGTPKDFTGYEMIDPLLNTCIVHNTDSDSTTELEHTGHIATKDGWMFRVPLQTRTSYGYLYNSNISDDQKAKKNFSSIINVPLEQMQDIMYKFNPYYTKNALKGRVIKNGNAIAFLEPMFASSIFMYDCVNKGFWDFIMGNLDESTVNNNMTRLIEQILALIGFHYLDGSSEHQTKFWSYAKKWGIRETEKSDIMEYNKTLLNLISNNGAWGNSDSFIFPPHSFSVLSKNLGRNKL